MKKIKLSIITVSLIGLAIAGTPIHDKMDSRIKGQSFSGTLADNVVNKDGLGMVAIQHHTGSASNNAELRIHKVIKDIVKNENDESKTENTLANIANNVIGTSDDRNTINGFGLSLNADGESCNDNNTQTINDQYLNNFCSGTNVEGQSCDDLNIQTINDIYTNGVCSGTNVEGQSCDDLDSTTSNDIYTNGVCTGEILGNYEFTSHTFTNCGKTGYTGPTLAQCKSSYSTSWDENSEYFSMSVNGIQQWTVPETNNYKIEVKGASGGTNYGNSYNSGKGAYLSGTFSLQKDQVLKILVGQIGGEFMYTGGGGGGSFVTTFDNTPLIIAGGGGGAGNSGGHAFDASTTTSGTNGHPVYGYGINGYGNSNNSNGGWGQSGAGIYGNGSGGANINNYSGPVAWAFTSGGVGGYTGGDINEDSCHGAPGGFGGGGAGSCNGGGGAGGYSGGGQGGGGGGSFNSGTNSSISINNIGHGSVKITKL